MDEQVRRMVRDVASGDHGLIPALARLWERRGGHDAVFEHAMEQAVAALSRAPDVLLSNRAFLHGIAVAFGVSDGELNAMAEAWEVSHGGMRLRRTRLRRFEYQAVSLAHAAGLNLDEAWEAVGYQIDHAPEEADDVVDSQTLAVAATCRLESVLSGRLWDLRQTGASVNEIGEVTLSLERASAACERLQGA